MYKHIHLFAHVCKELFETGPAKHQDPFGCCEFPNQAPTLDRLSNKRRMKYPDTGFGLPT